MNYSLLADAVVFLHFAFVIFATSGAIFVLRWRWVALLHVPAFIWAGYIMLSGEICPLTPLENAWRDRAGEQGYATGFVEHYIMPILYPARLTRELQTVLGICVFALNLDLYILIGFRTYRAIGKGNS